MWYTGCGVSLEEMVGFLPACSCPESQVTWEPGWDNKGGRGVEWEGGGGWWWDGCENTGCHVWDMSLPAYFHSPPKHLAISLVNGAMGKQMLAHLPII